MRFCLPLLACFLLAGCDEAEEQALLASAKPIAAQAEPEVTRAPIAGKQIADFTLLGPDGKKWSLADVSDRRLVAVVFVGTECPLVGLYMPRLKRLAEEFAPQGVALIGVDSNQQDTPEDIAEFVSAHAPTFPILRDVGNLVADQLGAKRTPEVFLLDDARRVCYSGRIDDQFGIERGVNFQRPGPNRQDLRIAIQEALAGKSISTPRSEPSGCIIGRIIAAEEESETTWSKHIARIFQRRCQECHRPNQIGPFPLLTFDDTLGWGGMIREVVNQNRMPPWHASPKYGEFVNDVRLTETEKKQINDWVAAGCPEGDPSEAPPPVDFPEGWQMTDPDQVVYIREEPFEIPAEGYLDYQYFVVNPGWKEDRWIVATEARPNARRVVHHMAVFLKPPGDFFSLRTQGKVTEIGGYVPGAHVSGFLAADEQAAEAEQPSVGHSEANEQPEDEAAILAPAGWELVFEMHYTPGGVKQHDRSGIALRFAADKPAESKSRRRWGNALATNTEFAIPAAASDWPIEAWHTVEQDSEMQWLNAHMHLRGKSFRFEAHYPNGEREILLDIPRYDFDWQTIYIFKQPKRMPLGTRLHCLATFDNSTENLRNPDAEKIVTYGHQTWDEMMAGTLGMIRDATPAELGQTPTANDAAIDILANYTKIDQVAAEKRHYYYYQRALYRKLKGDLPGALADFNAAIQENGVFVDAYFERAIARRDLGDLAGAMTDLQLTLSLRPHHAAALTERGRVQSAQNRPREALADFSAAIAADPRNAWGYYWRSGLRRALRDEAGALADLDYLIDEVSPGFIPARWERAKVLLALDRPAEAEREFEWCIEREPTRRVEAVRRLGPYYVRMQAYDSAVKQFQMLIDGPEEQHAQGHFFLGLVRIEQQRPEDGIAELEKAIELHPDHAAAHLAIARQQMRMKRDEDAARHYREVMRIEPGNAEVANDLAWLLATTTNEVVRKSDDPVRLAETSLAAANKNPARMDTLAAALAASGRFEDAARAARQAAELARAAGNTALAAQIEQRQRQYEQSEPYRR